MSELFETRLDAEAVMIDACNRLTKPLWSFKLYNPSGQRAPESHGSNSIPREVSGNTTTAHLFWQVSPIAGSRFEAQLHPG